MGPNTLDVGAWLGWLIIQKNEVRGSGDKGKALPGSPYSTQDTNTHTHTHTHTFNKTALLESAV
jgi:hypothetical protein